MSRYNTCDPPGRWTTCSTLQRGARSSSASKREQTIFKLISSYLCDPHRVNILSIWPTARLWETLSRVSPTLQDGRRLVLKLSCWSHPAEWLRVVGEKKANKVEGALHTHAQKNFSPPPQVRCRRRWRMHCAGAMRAGCQGRAGYRGRQHSVGADGEGDEDHRAPLWSVFSLLTARPRLGVMMRH